MTDKLDRPWRADAAGINRRLEESDIVPIRQARANGAYYSDIAKKYGVSSEQIRQICLRKSWKHVQ